MPDREAKRARENPEVESIESRPLDSSTSISPNHGEASDENPKDPKDNPNSIIPNNHPNPITHGPKFTQLDIHTQNQIRKIHQNLGHPDHRVLQLALRRYGWNEKDVSAVTDFSCPVCHEHQLPKAARPGKLSDPRDFNDLVSFDGAEWTDPHGKQYTFFHFIDTATNYHVAIPYQQRTTEGLIEAFSNAWLRWAGPPKTVMFDSATEANSEQFSRFLQEHSIRSYVIPTDAHWQLGRAERHGATLMSMLDKYHSERPIQNWDDFTQGLIHLCNAKNAMSRHEGYTPELWVLGKMKPVPGSNSNDALDSASFRALDETSTEGTRFHDQLSRRETARLAFVRADHCQSLRRALHARSRPDRIRFSIGEHVMYWKDGKGANPGSWHGPAKVLMLEGQNLVWISHLTKLFRCAPEHVRPLSQNEAGAVTDSNQGLYQLPERSGNGVFQFRELSSQTGPMPEQLPRPENQLRHEPEIVINNPIFPNPETANTDNIPNPPPSTASQPDDEPPVPPTPVADDPAITTPIPDDVDDDLVVQEMPHDFWEIRDKLLIRHHVCPRLEPFFPHDSWSCPVILDDIQSMRCTYGQYLSGGSFERTESWQDNVQSHLPFPEPWTGQTQFALRKVADIPEGDRSCLVNHTISESQNTGQGFHAEIFLTLDDFQKCLGKTYVQQEIYLASAAKRQKIEVKMKDLSPEEISLFKKAKDKEVESWLSTDTVRRILRHKVPEGQLLRSRWVLTWKPLDEVEQAETGMSRKAKARLVILGYEDPMLDSLPRDSPTLGRDSRMLALQAIASHKWGVRSFDIKTAFLRGSRQDDRILGVEPPQELRSKMGLRDDETCELLKGAYGLINAPLLWYCELKSALLSIGFIISPMDPCLFVLPRKSSSNDQGPKIHGVLGIHVDDGIGGGDETFERAIKLLEKKYPFGSQRHKAFTFTGVQLRQEINGDIILSQQGYLNDIAPININRDRRRTPELPVTSQELQDLRGLIGSIQYAATNTRPDLSCRLSLLQARVTCATVADLIQGNNLLNDAKRFPDTEIRIQALPPDQVRFLSFSDAAFATREKANSQKGCLILATTEEIDKTQMSAVSPLVWFSKKISRVVSSTLASETYALSGALDLLSWIRLHWAWMLNPNLEWQTPEITLKKLPPAFAVVDCKSLYDLLQKTSIPQCTEYRTMLEALVIRDRLKEGIIIKWVHSAAQMADSLTKDMDNSVLRSFLSRGRCILHDVDEILRQRADKKVRQQWYQQSSGPESALHAFALLLGIFDEAGCEEISLQS